MTSCAGELDTIEKCQQTRYSRKKWAVQKVNEDQTAFGTQIWTITFSLRKCLSLRASEDLLGRLARNETRGLVGRTLHGPETTPPPVPRRSLPQLPIASMGLSKKNHQKKCKVQARTALGEKTRQQPQHHRRITRLGWRVTQEPRKVSL